MHIYITNMNTHITYICLYAICVSIHIYITLMYTHITYICMHIYVYTYGCRHIYIYVCVYVCNICIYIYIYIYIYIIIFYSIALGCHWGMSDLSTTCLWPPTLPGQGGFLSILTCCPSIFFSTFLCIFHHLWCLA